VGDVAAAYLMIGPIWKLIDHGAPYDERATELKVDVKFDLALVRSLHTQDISLGLLLSNSVPLNSIATIASVFITLLRTDFFAWLAQVRGRYSIEHDGEKAQPIVPDIDRLQRALAKLFDVRNILVHEFPEALPFPENEVPEMIETTAAFINAADDGFAQLLYGLYPIGQQAMNRAAHAESAAIEQTLEKLVEEVARDTAGGHDANSARRVARVRGS
jgi:hypothetical protein